MLYKLTQTNKVFDAIEPMPFKTLADFSQIEKDLENLLAKNLLDVLFEANQLMPIFQERRLQAEADIYALNCDGDLMIFELKREGADKGAVHQALRYCEAAANWTYENLQDKLGTYTKDCDINLQIEHQSNFGLDDPLSKSAFNKQQHLMVVGNASSDNLVRNIDYWRSRGISIEFVPYRIYKIGNEHFFEFFSPPYDSHSNPALRKGVLFDTCSTYIEESIWYMCENDRVAAYGSQKHIVRYLGLGDIIFLFHKGEGIVAAGRVKSKIKEDIEQEAMYKDLEWLTPLPNRDQRKVLSTSQIKSILGHNFFWARTIKTPYLTMEESDRLLIALKDHLG